MASDPLTLYLPFSLVEEFNLARVIASDGRWSWSEGYVLLEKFALASHEKRFARELLRRRRNNERPRALTWTTSTRSPN